jgi:hypothetical protein
MSKAPLQPGPIQKSQAYYKIRIKGQLSLSWAEAFEGMQLTHTRCGDTLIAGILADQAALHGLLARIRDLNLTLISVNRIKPERAASRRQNRIK